MPAEDLIHSLCVPVTVQPDCPLPDWLRELVERERVAAYDPGRVGDAEVLAYLHTGVRPGPLKRVHSRLLTKLHDVRGLDPVKQLDLAETEALERLRGHLTRLRGETISAARARSVVGQDAVS